MSDFQIRPALRRRLKARVGVAGPSGSGKTYSSILLMRGLVGNEGRIAVIDTEQGSSEMYMGLGATDKQPAGFDVLTLDAPYTPARYMAALDAVEKAGYDGCVVDQISNAWAGKGGVLEFVDNARFANGSTKGFSAWKEATPLQHGFIERLLAFKGHLIVTMRSKSEWVVEKDERGRSAPRKIGMSPVQRDGIEYEFQIMLDLNEGGQASVSKDRTSLLMGTYFKADVEVGNKLRGFLDSGTELAAQPTRQPESQPATKSEQTQTKVEQPKSEPVASEPVAQPQASNNNGLISSAQHKLLIETAKNAGIKPNALRPILARICGTEKASEVPEAKFIEVMRELVPRETAA